MYLLKQTPNEESNGRSISTNKLNSSNSDVKNFFNQSSDTKKVDSNTEIKSVVTKKEEPIVKKYFRFLEF